MGKECEEQARCFREKTGKREEKVNRRFTET